MRTGSAPTRIESLRDRGAQQALRQRRLRVVINGQDALAQLSQGTGQVGG